MTKSWHYPSINEMKTITQTEANQIVNNVCTSFQKWRSIESESEKVGLFDDPMAEKFFMAILKLAEMNRDITKMELYNLSYMGCVLYPAINIILGINGVKVDLKDYLNLRDFEILVENT